MKAISPDGAHQRAFTEEKPRFAFDAGKDLAAQQKAAKEKLRELLGKEPELVDLNVRVEFTKEFEDFVEKRILFSVEKDVDAVGHLWLPKKAAGKVPCFICLQGHSTGMHISMGRALYPGDEKSIGGGDRDFAVQCIRHGVAAFALEQRAMGERRIPMEEDTEDTPTHPRCHVPSMNALLLGRTMIGERVWDVSRAVDLLLTFPEIDGTRIGCMGNSGGGTTTYYAACMEERIALAVPSCAVCSYKDSIGAMEHCVCNFVPHIAENFDMGDLALTIAPRKLIVVSGLHDPIFPQPGVQKEFRTVKSIFKAAGKEENCRLIVGGEGHRFYAKEAWEAIEEML